MLLGLCGPIRQIETKSSGSAAIILIYINGTFHALMTRDKDM